ncbi:hypothetical+protein [Methylocapsa aurea]|uniref:autotransporter outer membrane beta-barrel domain-containing protein n=1 Tax=Methylocapsa aurea TaxID=663610 RepID=UPI003D18DE85
MAYASFSGLATRGLVAGLAFIPAASAQSVDIPLQLAQAKTGVILTINVGIGGQAPRPYLFDTGSSLFNAAYSADAFGSVPSSMASSLPTGVSYSYTSGNTFTGNLVAAPSLVFYPAGATQAGAGVTLNATTPSGAQSGFVINAIYSRNGVAIGDLVPLQGLGAFQGYYGIFGAGDFAQFRTGTGANSSTTVVGSVLGQAVVPGTTAGYVVAANGQALSSLNAAIPGASVNGPKVGQSVTACSPCVMLGLTPALLAQFRPVNMLAWTSPPGNTPRNFPNSNAPSSWEYGVNMNYALVKAGVTTSLQNVPTLLDTGTLIVQLNSKSLDGAQSLPTGSTLTSVGGAIGATPTTDQLFSAGPYRVALNNASNLTINGVGFFLQNSVLYDLAGHAVGYTPNFVTDQTISTTGSAPLVIGSDSVPLGLAGVISGPGGVTVAAGGSAALSGANTYTGATTVTGGALALVGPGSISTSSGVSVSAGGLFDISGATAPAKIASLSGDATGAVALGANTLTLSNASGSFAGAIVGAGGVSLRAGVETLSGVNRYLGPTSVDGGTLIVDGSIASSSLTTVRAGATLSGVGTLGALTVDRGGVFAPGSGAAASATAVAGDLAFAGGSTYLVQIDPVTASRAAVAGKASLTGGAVVASYAPGSYLARSYTILTAANGLGGTSFTGLASPNLPPGLTQSLSYSTNEVYLSLNANLASAALLPSDQRGVASGLDHYFNAGGLLPPNFIKVFGLGGAALASLSGEAATVAQQTIFQSGGRFLDTILEPSIPGRYGGDVGGVGSIAPALAYAESEPRIANEISHIAGTPTRAASDAARQLSIWATSFGGRGHLAGDADRTGSHDVAANLFGVAAGLDYRVDPQTTLGVAMAGGGENWDLSEGLGGGHGDFLQAGGYASTRFDALHVSAAFAFSEHWLSTQRTSAFGDMLAGASNAQSYGGRVESGYRLATSLGGVTPYVGAQAQSLSTPGYTESDATGGGFALSYRGRTSSDMRGEAGARFDRIVAAPGDTVLLLRARAAYAHDWVGNPILAASFALLPGSSFSVEGARPIKNASLVTTGLELRLPRGTALFAKFDGEFARRSQNYVGSAGLRYNW